MHVYPMAASPVPDPGLLGLSGTRKTGAEERSFQLEASCTITCSAVIWVGAEQQVFGSHLSIN